MLWLFGIFFSRYNYDKRMSELYAADDHPLKSSELTFSTLSVLDNSGAATMIPTPPTTNGSVYSDQLNAELNSVAVDWKAARNKTICSCSTPFDQFSRKVSVKKR